MVITILLRQCHKIFLGGTQNNTSINNNTVVFFCFEYSWQFVAQILLTDMLQLELCFVLNLLEYILGIDSITVVCIRSNLHFVSFMY